MLVTRSGSVTSMRCVAEVKYFSIGSLLTVMAPWPGRKRTRATACLRRPVVWLSGAGMASVMSFLVPAQPARRAWGSSSGSGFWAAWGCSGPA